MEDKRDLGKLIKQRLADAEAEPAHHLWSTIEETLERKRKRRAGFIWFWSGIGALLGIMAIAYFTMNTAQTHTNSAPEETISNTQEASLSDTKKDTVQKATKTIERETNSIPITDSLMGKPIDIPSKTISGIPTVTKSSPYQGKTELQNTKERSSSPNTKKTISSNSKESLTDINAVKTNKPRSELPSKINSKKIPPKEEGTNTVTTAQKNKNETTTAYTKTPKVTDSIKSIPNEINKDSILAKVLLPKKPAKDEEEPIKKILDPSKWLFSAQLAPNYYDYLSKGNPFEQSLNAGKTRGNSSLSYGVLINMPISDKLTFRFGFRKSNFKLTVKDAVSGQDAAGNSLIFRDVAILRNAVPIPTSISDAINNGERFDITQKMNYSEIPFEVSYTLLKGTISVDAIGGLSTLLLGKNSLRISNDTGSVAIGSGRYLKKVAIAPTLGLGFRYQFNEKIRIDLEPVFRYHSNAFDNDYRNRRPYSLGIQTGLTLKL